MIERSSRRRERRAFRSLPRTKAEKEEGCIAMANGQRTHVTFSALPAKKLATVTKRNVEICHPILEIDLNYIIHSSCQTEIENVSTSARIVGSQHYCFTDFVDGKHCDSATEGD